MADVFSNAAFFLSAASPEGFVRDGLPQVAIAGRSNVGKSSVINRLCQRKNLARVGNTPGKTSQINYFLLPGRGYLVDLPGYGYAKVSKAEQARWGRLMEAYFASGLVTGGLLIVDARHAPTAADQTMAQWFRDAGRTFYVAANKADKLKKSEILPNIERITGALSLREENALILFSTVDGTGRETLLARLETFFP